MSFDTIILWIMAAGLLIGAMDRILGNRFDLGTAFEEGFYAMGPLALGMVGMIVLSPVIARLLGPLLVPVFQGIGADPAMFASLLAIDMGGYHLAVELAEDPGIGLFSGLIVSSMLGCTLVFSIPVGLGLIEETDQPFFARGLLAGLVMLPLGSLIGGLVAGFKLPVLLMNLVPVLAFSLLLALGMKVAPDALIASSLRFSRGLVILITVGLASAGFEMITGVVILPGLAPIDEALLVVGRIAVVLLGTFPALRLIIRVLDRPLNRVGRALGMRSTGAAGLVIALANAIPVFKMMPEMSPRGKVINTAWLVSASSTLGAHLGFTAGIAPDMVAAVIVGKLSAGVLAIAYALVLLAGEEDQDLKPELS